MQGYLFGIDTGLSDYSPSISDTISKSYFGETYEASMEVLIKMHKYYPAWTGYEIYDELNEVIEWFFTTLGVSFEDDENGIYIGVP